MSSRKDRQEGIAAVPNSPSRSQKTKTMPIYPSPPNSPPRTKPGVSEARTKVADELHSPGTGSSVIPTPPTSPRQETSNLTPQKEKSPENKSHMNASTLRTLLGLENWRCGGLRTNKKEYCRMRIPESKKGQIDSKIKSMVNLTQSSPELETELHKLVMLVHCSYHDDNDTKKLRIEAWTTAFPIPDEGTKPAMSVEKQIKKALGGVSAKCMWITVDDKHCDLGIGGQKVMNCTKTIDEIVKPEVYLDDAYLDFLLKVLETNMYCSHHINKQPFRKLELWKSSIIEIRKMAGLELVQSIESNTLEGLENPTRTQETKNHPIKMSNDSVLQTRGLPTPRNSPRLSPEFDRDLATFWPDAYDTTSFEIIERSDKLDGYKSSYDFVQKELTIPLDLDDQRSGYVYLYEVEGNKGFVKIGYTSRSIETRHKEWRFDCNRDPKVLYPVPSSSAMVVPNARRVETLCHAELNHRKIRIYCRGCLKQHIEWFEVSPAEAIAVIQKWSKWMATCPYQSIELRSGVKWTLKSEESQRSRNMDQFMKKI